MCNFAESLTPRSVPHPTEATEPWTLLPGNGEQCDEMSVDVETCLELSGVCFLGK